MAYWKLSTRVFPLLVLVLAFFQYINTLPHEYAWDDKLVITGNDYTKKGREGLLDIFTKRVSVPYKSEYRPIPQAMFALEYDLFHANPHVAHFFNILWYSLSCLLLYFFIGFSFPRLDPLFPFLAVLLFVVHPLHVEAVANIKSRDEILNLFFGLCSVMLFVKAVEESSWRCLVAGLVCFGFAFLSKSNAVTFLPISALVAWYRSEHLKISRKLAVFTVSILVCSSGLVVLARYLQSTVSGDTGLFLNSTVLNNIFLWTTHPEQILPTSLVIILRYLKLFLYPHPLIHLYGYNQIPLSSWRDYETWAVMLGIAAVVWSVFRMWRQKPPLVFGLIFFAITYSVYSNLFFLAPDTMADRYMFIPSVGLCIVFVDAIFRLAQVDFEKPAFVTGKSKAVVALFLLVITGYSVRTFIGNTDWRNDKTLIANRIQYMQNNAAAQAIYGYTLEKESLEATSPGVSRERRLAAMKAFTRAIDIYPDFYWAWISIGKIFAEQQVVDKAELCFIKAQRIEPLNSDAYFYLGTLYLAQEDQDLAITYLEKVVLLDPKMEDAYVVLGKAYLRANEIENLGSMAMSARKRFPNNLELEALLATYYFRKQNYGEAFALARAVLSKDPGNVLALSILSSPSAQIF